MKKEKHEIIEELLKQLISHKDDNIVCIIDDINKKYIITETIDKKYAGRIYKAQQLYNNSYLFNHDATTIFDNIDELIGIFIQLFVQLNLKIDYSTFNKIQKNYDDDFLISNYEKLLNETINKNDKQNDKQ